MAANPTIAILGNELYVILKKKIEAELLTRGEAVEMLEEIIYELQNPRLEMKARLEQ
jgi:hypothetical protein